MLVTIDKAGRVVIPAAIREKAGLAPGTHLEVLVDDLSIRLVPSAPGPKVVRSGKRLVVRPTVPRKDLPAIDFGRLLDEERDRFPW